MAAEDKKGDSKKQITEKQRYNFIGFDVFPGTPKDLFVSEAEKSEHVNAIKTKREKGDVVRDECKLLEERVTFIDRIVLTVACLVIIGTFAVPWFSAYNVIVEEATEEPIAAVVDSALTDSTMVAMSNSATAASQIMDSTVLTATTDGSSVNSDKDPFADEILTGIVAKKKIHKEYESLAGYGILVSIGEVGGYVFGSGFILMLSGVLCLLFLLTCLAIPAYTLYGLYGMKGDADKQALALKGVLKYNWIPVIIFTLIIVLSFVGADYGFVGKDVFTSIGSSYGPGVLLGTLSYGMVIALGAFILNALKGVEI